MDMRERRHHGRLSSKFLPPATSLYNAMQAIIGAGLRERYEIPLQLPPDIAGLLETLNEAPTGEKGVRDQPEKLKEPVSKALTKVALSARAYPIHTSRQVKSCGAAGRALERCRSSHGDRGVGPIVCHWPSLRTILRA
jgi:hypothetical protein